MKNWWTKYWPYILLLFALIIGGPIVINESYKADKIIYVTKWNAEDVLGYYGSILGSIIAVATLATTIIFTKKQIQRESYLNWANEKWDRLDAVFMRILDSINPTEVLKNVMDTSYAEPSRAINYLQKYQMNCKIACDQLNANLNMDDYPKFKELIDSIAATAEEFTEISQKLITLYSDYRLLNYRADALNASKIERERPGSFTQENVSFNEDVLKKTENMTFASINTQITEVNDMFIKTYETQYRALLQLKGTTFEVVRRDTQKHADDILNWRGK